MVAEFFFWPSLWFVLLQTFKQPLPTTFGICAKRVFLMDTFIAWRTESAATHLAFLVPKTKSSIQCKAVRHRKCVTENRSSSSKETTVVLMSRLLPIFPALCRSSTKRATNIKFRSRGKILILKCLQLTSLMNSVRKFTGRKCPFTKRIMLFLLISAQKPMIFQLRQLLTNWQARTIFFCQEFWFS